MRILFFSIICCLIAACGAAERSSKQQDPQTNSANSTTDGQPLPTDFLSFYQNFHQDSGFQMAHVQWPLQGQQTLQLDSTTRVKAPITWQPENWKRHHPLDFQEGIFKQEFKMMGDAMVIEIVFSEELQLLQERRFAKIAGDDWMLIYYSEMY